MEDLRTTAEGVKKYEEAFQTLQNEYRVFIWLYSFSFGGMEMEVEMMLWIIYGLLAVTVAGWILLGIFHRKFGMYFLPYLISLLGLTLLMVSIFLIGGWEGMGVGMISFAVVAIGLLAGLTVYVYSLVKKKRTFSS
ncbi:hypothetical protein EBO34_17375 [Alteribacter keqinensis]|uniref:Uncharacterized protein n=2 Tax=Alteribacter keqinensis TaxID=2483800 RepID=A0A3M7TPM1_9BACI|nr:hypothetical protein EBO34_17375 [Alteribacter keqinensis]